MVSGGEWRGGENGEVVESGKVVSGGEWRGGQGWEVVSRD